MNSSYLQGLGIHLGNHRPVDMTGIPQIPARAQQLLALGHQELPPEVEVESNAAIAAAMREIQIRKREVIKAEYVPDTDENFEE